MLGRLFRLDFVTVYNTGYETSGGGIFVGPGNVFKKDEASQSNYERLAS